jgi:hypothetical protein
VENFAQIAQECPLLILTQSFCATEGLSLTPPPSNEQVSWNMCISELHSSTFGFLEFADSNKCCGHFGSNYHSADYASAGMRDIHVLSQSVWLLCDVVLPLSALL